MKQHLDEFCRKHGLLFILIALSACIFLFHLTKNPPGFFVDEAVYGYEAYHVMTHGGNSSNGEFLPRYFRKPGGDQRSHSSVVYAMIPSIALFGVTPWAVRIVSVVASLMLLTLLYLLLIKKLSLPVVFFTLIWWPISGWTFLISRNGVEIMMACLTGFTALFLMIFYWRRESLSGGKHVSLRRVSVHAALIGLACCYAFYIHSAGKILGIGYSMLALVVTLLVYYKRRRYEYLLPPFIILLFVVLTCLLSLRYLTDGTFFYKTDELKIHCAGREVECFKANLVSHIDPRTYFMPAQPPHDFPVFRHNIPGTSVLPTLFVPLIFFGLTSLFYRLYKRKDGMLLFIIPTFMLGIIPASFTFRGFDTWRSYALLPLFYIVAAYGVNALFGFLRKVQKWNGYCLYILLFLIGGFCVGQATHSLSAAYAYEYNVNAAGISGWQHGYGEVVKYVKTVYSEYDVIRVTNSIAYDPHLHIRFFDPDQKLKKIQLINMADPLPQDIEGGTRLNVLYVVTPGEKPKGFIVKHTVFYPSGEAAFYVGERGK